MASVTADEAKDDPSELQSHLAQDKTGGGKRIQ
jgi:hypothetical protein